MNMFISSSSCTSDVILEQVIDIIADHLNQNRKQNEDTNQFSADLSHSQTDFAT